MATNRFGITVCDACRKPIGNDVGQRIINEFTIHNTAECFHAYTVKVEKGILKTAYNLDPRNKSKQ